LNCTVTRSGEQFLCEALSKSCHALHQSEVVHGDREHMVICLLQHDKTCDMVISKQWKMRMA